MSRGASNQLICALLAIAGALLLAACGSSSSDSGDSGGGGEQFTTAEFEKTLDAVKEDSGENVELLEVQITSAGTDYTIRSGEKATGLHFDPGSSEGQDVTVEVTGTGSLADSAFPISVVDPAAIDTMVAGAPKASGASDFEVTVMTLGKQFTPELGWTVNGDGDGRTGLVLQASPDGSGLTAPGGTVPGGTSTSGSATDTGAAAPTGGTDPAAIAQCVQAAGTDVAKIQACTQ